MTIRLMALLLLFFPVTACGVMPPLAHVEVTVVDDDNKPVEGAYAYVTPFTNPATGQLLRMKMSLVALLPGAVARK